jgi:hypothetical protein
MAVEMTPGLIELRRALRWPQADAAAATRRWFGALGETVSLLRVAEQCGITRRYPQKVLRWGISQLVLDRWIHRRMKMARHAGDDQSGATRLDDLTELLEHQSHTEQVDTKDRVDVGLLG